jgi:hypothetical protein
MRATDGRSIISGSRMAPGERKLVGSVLAGLMPGVPEGHRAEILKRVGISLVRNLAPGSEAPMESARRVAKFLNNGPYMKGLREKAGIKAFTPEELVALVRKGVELRESRSG